MSVSLIDLNFKLEGKIVLKYAWIVIRFYYKRNCEVKWSGQLINDRNCLLEDLKRRKGRKTPAVY